MKHEKSLRLTVHQDTAGICIGNNHVLPQSLGAVDILNEIGELIVSDRSLIVLQNIPPRATCEGADIIRGDGGCRDQ